MPKTAVKLSDLVDELMDKQFGPQQLRLARIAGQWERLLPAELASHCRITGLSAGRLTVQTDLPVYRHELQMCGTELLNQLQLNCPREKIKEIKFVL